MKVKLLELRDEGTFIPLLCVDMNYDRECPGGISEEETRAALDAANVQGYYLRRCGYPCDGRPNIAITHLDASGGKCLNDPYSWGGRTYPVAHHYIIENWEKLRDGDVVDVEFILGEKPTPKVSKRLEPYAPSTVIGSG